MPNRFSMADWIPCRSQNEFMYSSARNIVALCPRQSGKSHIAVNLAGRRIASNWGVPDGIQIERQYAFIGKTIGSAHNTLWKFAQYMWPRGMIREINASRHQIITYNGARCIFCGSTNVESAIEGNGLCGVVLDEAAYHIPGKFESVIAPMRIRQNGWAIILGVPKRGAPSSQWFYELCEQYRHSRDANMAYYSWSPEEVMTRQQITEAKKLCDEKTYREQYLCEWVSGGRCAYYSFDDRNILSSYEYNPSNRIMVCCDFNVDYMSWILCQRVGKARIVAFRELRHRDTNVKEMIRRVIRLYPDAMFEFYGDPAGSQRNVAADKIFDGGKIEFGTAWKIITSELKSAKKRFVLRVAPSHPTQADRVTDMNIALCNSDDKRSFFVHKSCKELINDLSNQSWKECVYQLDTSIKSIGHAADAVGYMISYIRPQTLSGISEDVIRRLHEK